MAEMKKIQIVVTVPATTMDGSKLKEAMEWLSTKITGVDKSQFEVNMVVLKSTGDEEDNQEISDFCLKLGITHETRYIEEKVLDSIKPDYVLMENLPSKRKSSSRSSSISTREFHSIYDSMFEEEKQLGKGGFGKVFLCKNSLDGALYAVKKIPFADVEVSRITREPILMAKLHHPNVVRYYHSWIENGATPLSTSEYDEYSLASEDQDLPLPLTPTKTLHISMEYCPNSLAKKMDDGLDPDEIPKLITQMIKGMKAIHGAGIIHRDISKHNILIDSFGNVKITDFGIAVPFDGHGDTILVVSKVYGHAMYRAPEMCKIDPETSTKGDIFSLGLIIYEMLYPMKFDMERIQTFDALRAGTFNWDGIDIKTDLLKFLENDPKDRFSAEELLQSAGDICFLKGWISLDSTKEEGSKN